MKKNLLSIVILALLIVNVVLTSVMLFSVTGTMKKTANLIDSISVAPVDSSAYPAKAKRPSNSRMSKEKLEENGFEKLPSWQDATKRYVKLLMNS